ncbi:hypothetical protein ACFST9_04120 [Hymenobacter monticola]|uniref:HNH nuclease domain-containing protein n=1 Tax=Hymenobacter monticola TaxID=1705399 RepID=A0ABY4B854_9BACT|nr:hypothetical protein [Hymenobacter monticola]UOE32860.1 hypothetical protein MTP16_17200 [Hymenobacter monticola]
MLEGKTYFLLNGEYATRIDWHNSYVITESGRVWSIVNDEPGKELEIRKFEKGGKLYVLHPSYYHTWLFGKRTPVLTIDLVIDRSPYDVKLAVTAPLKLRMKSRMRKEIEYCIHELVAKYFITNPEGYEFVEHIDQNRLNNHFTNLRWTPFDPRMQDRYQGYYYKKLPQHLIDFAEAHYNSDEKSGDLT